MTFVMTSRWKVVQSKISYLHSMVRHICLSTLSSSRLWYIYRCINILEKCTAVSFRKAHSKLLHWTLKWQVFPKRR